MNAANQQKVIQATNDGLVRIRNLEIIYFCSFCNAIGTQAALFAGYQSSVISATPVIGLQSVDLAGHTVTVPIFWMYAFWLGMGIGIIASMQVLLSVAYLATYGQGLALRGPLGSMVKAVDGMVVEQGQIIYWFVVTVVSTTVGCIGMYFCMMTALGALLSSILTLFGTVLWYQSCLRIYNRFQVDTTSRYYEERQYKEFQLILPNSLKEKHTKVQQQEKLHHEGYLLTTLGSNSMIGNNSWKQKYFVLDEQNINIYNDEFTYNNNSYLKANLRPICLEGLKLELQSESTTMHILKLIPTDPDDDRSVFEIRTKSMTDAIAWHDIIKKAIDKYNLPVWKDEFSLTKSL